MRIARVDFPDYVSYSLGGDAKNWLSHYSRYVGRKGSLNFVVALFAYPVHLHRAHGLRGMPVHNLLAPP